MFNFFFLVFFVNIVKQNKNTKKNKKNKIAPADVRDGFMKLTIARLKALIGRYGDLLKVPEKRLAHMYWLYHTTHGKSQKERVKLLLSALGFYSQGELLAYDPALETSDDNAPETDKDDDDEEMNQ